MAVKVSDLKDQVGVGGPHPFLYCRCCGGEYSANKGDYFLLPPDEVMTCCEQELVLVTKRVVYQEVR